MYLKSIFNYMLLTLRFLINIAGRLLIFRFFPNPPDLIRTPRLLIFKYLTDELVLFSSTFTNCLSLCAPLIYQRYFDAYSIFIAVNHRRVDLEHFFNFFIYFCLFVWLVSIYLLYSFFFVRQF